MERRINVSPHAFEYLAKLSRLILDSLLAKWLLCHLLVDNQSRFITISSTLRSFLVKSTAFKLLFTNFTSNKLLPISISRYLSSFRLVLSGNHSISLFFFFVTSSTHQLSSTPFGQRMVAEGTRNRARFRGLICPTCFHPSLRRVTVARNYANEIVFANGTRSSKGNYSRVEEEGLNAPRYR